MRLKEYLDLNHVTYQGFAEIIKTSKFTIHQILHGKRYPNMKLAIEIEKRTSGKVTLYDWELTENEDSNTIKKNKKKKSKKIN